MNIFEKLAYGIVLGLRKAWGFLTQPIPAWLMNLCTQIGKIIFTLFQKAAQDYVNLIMEKIVSIDKMCDDLSNDQKFGRVWDYAKELLPEWKESDIDTLIQSLFAKLKDEGVV